MYSYERKARFQGSPEALLKSMKESVDAMLAARVKLRTVHLALGELARDATGVGFKDVYEDPDVRAVAKQLSALDREIGDAFGNVERLEKALRKKVV